MRKRLERLKAEQALKRLDEIDKLLTNAGIPKWVELVDESFTRVSLSNDPVSRLKWYLLRRKDVKTDEKIYEIGLERDMEDFAKRLQQGSVMDM